MKTRTPNELKRAASILVGTETLSEDHGKILPQLSCTQFGLLVLALEWAAGKENFLSELIEGVEEIWKDAGIGITEDGTPYPLNPVIQ